MFDYITKKEPIVLCNNYYKNMTNINDSYNLIYECSKVDILDKCLNKICTKDMCNDYNTITYNSFEKVFYATKFGSMDLIYVLDLDYIEIDMFVINGPHKFLGYINDLYYNCNDLLIYVVTSCFVYSINTSGMIVNVCFDIKNLCLSDNELCNSYLSSVYKCKDFYYIGYSINNSTYIGVISKFGNLINKLYIEDYIIINSIVKIGCSINLLVTKKDHYSYIYYTTIKCCEDIECQKNNIIKKMSCSNKKTAELINREALKLENYIKKTNCVDDLLKFNDKTTNIIKNITGLEKNILENMKK